MIRLVRFRPRMAAIVLAVLLAGCAQPAPLSSPTAALAPPTAAPAKPTTAPATQPTTAAAAPAAQPTAAAQAPAAAKPAGAVPSFKDVVAAANREGEVVVFGRTPLRESLDKMMPEFNKRFGTNIKISTVPMDAREIATRMIAEAKQPVGTGDLAWGHTSTSILTLQKAGISTTYPWVEVFGQELPLIKTRVEGVQEPLRGNGLEAFHAPYGLIYNVNAIKPEELPKTWADLGDPKWSGQFANDPGGSAFGLLINQMSEQEIMDIVAKVKANHPVITQAASDTIQRVIAQQVLFGVGPVDTAEAQRLAGAPINWVLLNPTGAAQTVFFTPPNPPHPNAAHLYTAWLATEGLALLGEIEGHGQLYPGSGSKFANAVEAQNIKVSMGTTPETITKEDEMT